jgi:hypothetical protein
VEPPQNGFTYELAPENGLARCVPCGGFVAVRVGVLVGPVVVRVGVFVAPGVTGVFVRVGV